MKIALLPGHASTAEGATCCAGYYEGFGEYSLAYTYLSALANHLTKYGHIVTITRRENTGGINPSHSAKAANATGADIAIECHFNSSPGAHGATVLYWGKSATGKQFADMLSGKLAAILGIRDRHGLPIMSEEDRGYAAFHRSRMPFFMLEPCFAGSNPDEARTFGALIKSGEWAPRAAKAIADCIAAVYYKPQEN